jgi:hypothetical protein
VVSDSLIDASHWDDNLSSTDPVSKTASVWTVEPSHDVEWAKSVPWSNQTSAIVSANQYLPLEVSCKERRSLHVDIRANSNIISLSYRVVTECLRAGLRDQPACHAAMKSKGILHHVECLRLALLAEFFSYWQVS